jgi:hypothetical protein
MTAGSPGDGTRGEATRSFARAGCHPRRYFPLGPFFALSCLGFLTFLPPLSFFAIVYLRYLSPGS